MTHAPITEPTLEEMEAALADIEAVDWEAEDHRAPEAQRNNFRPWVLQKADSDPVALACGDNRDQAIKRARVLRMAPGATARAIRLERALRRIAKMHRSMADLEGAEPSAVRDWFHVLTGIAVDALSPTLTEATPND